MKTSFVRSLSLADSAGIAVVAAVEKWEAHQRFPRDSVFSTVVLTLACRGLSADTRPASTTRPKRCVPACWQWRRSLCCVLLWPQADAPSFLGRRCRLHLLQHGPRTVNKHAAQVGVASLADAAKLRFAFFLSPIPARPRCQIAHGPIPFPVRTFHGHGPCFQPLPRCCRQSQP
jgi:hypothetical protein